MSDAPVVVEVIRGMLHIDAPTGLQRLSLLGALNVPLGHIEKVDVTDKPINAIKGWRTGIGMPDLRMGTWRHDGVKDYVAVHVTLRGVVITLRDEKYARVIVSVDDPEALKSRIDHATS
jgi:hypothetical protein